MSRKRPASLTPMTLNIYLGAMLATACGAPEYGDRTGSGPQSAEGTEDQATPDEDQPQEFDHIITPPQEYYDAIFEKTLAHADDTSRFNLAGQTQVLWLNFDGASITKGFRDGQSFILCKSRAQVPASGLSPATRQSIVEDTQAHYDKARARIKVTQTKPDRRPYTTIHVGGNYGDLGCSGNRGIVGVAPYDVGNANPDDVGFAFTAGIKSTRLVAETVAHEAGHSFGLAHIDNPAAIMNPSASPQIQGFDRGKLVGKSSYQDSPQVLRKVLGEASPTQPPKDPIDFPPQPNPDPPPAPDPKPTPDPVPAPQPTPAPKPTPIPAPNPSPGGPKLPINIPGIDQILSSIPGLDQILSIANILPTLVPGQILDITALKPLLDKILGGVLGGGNGLPLPIPGGGGSGGLPGGIDINDLLGLAGGLGGKGGIDAILTIIGVAGNTGGALPGGGKLPIDIQKALDVLRNLTGGGQGIDISALAGLVGGGSGALSPILDALQDALNGLARNGQSGGPAALPTGVPDLSILLGLIGGPNGVDITDLPGLCNNLKHSVGLVNSQYTGDTAAH